MKQDQSDVSTGITIEADLIFRQYLVKIVLMAALPFLSYFLFQELLHGSIAIIAMVTAMLAITVSLYFQALKAGTSLQAHWRYDILAHAFLLTFAISLIYQIDFQGKYSRLPWFFVFAVVSFFLLNARQGFSWCAALLVAQLLIGRIAPSPGGPALIEDLNQRFLVTYFLVVVLSFFAENIRSGYRRELIGRMARLKSAEEKQRTAYKQLQREAHCREQAENRLRSLTDNLDIGIFRTGIDSQGRFFDANPAMVQMLGYHSQADLQMVGMGKILANPEDWKALAAAVEAQGAAKNVELALKKSDKTLFTASVSAAAIPGADGEIRFMDGIVEDISYRKSLEHQVRQSQKMEAIGTLAGGIAHDFNNILTAIIGFAELATEDVPRGSAVHENLEEILLGGTRAKELVRQILAFSRQQNQEKRPIQIGPIVKETLKLLRSTLPATLSIRQHIPGNLGSVRADPTQIHQIMLNLCTNAEHAMRDRGGTLEVTLDQQDMDARDVRMVPDLAPGRYLILKVSDSGTGIDANIQETIFDPYFTTKKVGEGTGMGLAVISGIVKSLSGSITVHSRLEKGTTFTVYLPVILREIAAKPADGNDLPGGTERILFVDDEEALARLGKRRLEKMGYAVESRTSPVEALALFRHDPARFDLVITDMTMPAMTGDRLASAVLKIRPGMPVILCTGFSGRISRKKARKIGIREFVMKPLVARELARAVRKVLDAPPVAGG